VISRVAVEPVSNGDYRIKAVCGGGQVKYYKESGTNHLTCSAGEADTFGSHSEAQEVADTLNC